MASISPAFTTTLLSGTAPARGRDRLGKHQSGQDQATFVVGLRTNASVGYGFGRGLRVALADDYLRNSATRIGYFAKDGGIGVKGSIRVSGVLTIVRSNQR